MKCFRKYLGILLSVLFLLTCSTDLRAEEPLQIGMDAYVAEDGVLKLYVNHNKGESFNILPENVKVVFGNNEMVTESVSKLIDKNVPISYKCVVDVSGSMNQQRIDQAKEVIKELARRKKTEDQIAITALGNELIQSEYMSDSLEIAEKADILKLTKEDTNLYYAIVQEIKGLQTADEVGRKRCLIIFSDGADDQAVGITKEEAEKAVTDSHIPVFTVGLLKDKNSEKSMEMAKILGSFARISSGGEHFAPALDDISTEDIAGAILDRLNYSFVLEEGLENVKVEGKEVVLKVTISTGDGETAEDSMNVPESDIKIIHEEQLKAYGEPEVETVVEEPEVETVVVVEEPEEESIFEKYKVYIFAGAGLLLLFIIIVVIILSKNKKPQMEEAEAEQNFEPVNDASPTMNLDDSRTIGGFNNEGLTVAPVDYGMPKPEMKQKKHQITLVQLGKQTDKKYSIGISDKCTIGRSAVKNTLGIPTDTALSEVHATIVAEKGRLYIRDEKSTNGTFVNGVPITGKFELGQDDIILIGSYEYRISWK